MRVAPRQPDETKLFGLDTARDLGAEPPLFVAPQTVLFDECRSLGFCHHARTRRGAGFKAANTARFAAPRAISQGGLAAVQHFQHQVGETAEWRIQKARAAEAALQKNALAVREGLKAELAVIGADAGGPDAA